MADDLLLEKVHDLSDLELAILLCLVSREHGIISTPSDTIDDLIEELQLVCPTLDLLHKLRLDAKQD